MTAGRHVEKIRMAISQQWFDHWIHFMFGSTVWLIISAARKGRAFKFYIDLGTEEHNKICTQICKWRGQNRVTKILILHPVLISGIVIGKPFIFYAGLGGRSITTFIYTEIWE